MGPRFCMSEKRGWVRTQGRQITEYTDISAKLPVRLLEI